ncbi:MAG: HAMP domain-containing protein [Acidobacteria bacterium]|nr:HAMP domain-containing protein [Acidobacteriota bacterium]
MNTRSIRFRLTVWYTAVLGFALLAFAAGTWLAMRHSLYAAVDDSLRDRAEGVRRFMYAQIEALSIEEIRDEFKEHSVLGPAGDLFQVCDAKGAWLYRSAALESAQVPILLPKDVSAKPHFENRLIQNTPLRLFSREVVVRGKPYTVQIAAPMHEIDEALEDVRWILLFLAPALLAVASLGGYWLSGRALNPVDAITRAARSINAQSLSHRLEIPKTGDELQRLSETLNEMLDRLEDSFHRVTRFTADASHELRTPVALIRTTSELALRRTRSAEEYETALRQVLSESERTSALIENLLTLARPDSGSESLDKRPLDLLQLLRETASQGETLALGRGIRFAFEADSAPLIILGDGPAVRRLILILLDNAVKYTPEGGEVALRAAGDQGFVRIEVRDTGVGIAQTDLPHIFERFYRADAARSRQSGGAGLGLAIAKWIVEQHGGHIEAESELGRGSTFRVRLLQASSALPTGHPGSAGLST